MSVCQLSVVSCQLSNVSWQLAVGSWQLSFVVVSCSFSVCQAGSRCGSRLDLGPYDPSQQRYPRHSAKDLHKVSYLHDLFGENMIQHCLQQHGTFSSIVA